MTHLWVYDGELQGTSLALMAKGPDFSTPGKTARYTDAIEVTSDDERWLKSHLLGPDGKWQPMMTARYRRTG